MDVGLIGEHARNALAKVLANLTAIRLQRYFEKFLSDTRKHQVHVTASAVPRRIARALYRRHEVTRFGQGFARFDLGSDILALVAVEAEHGEQLVVPLWGGLYLLQTQPASAR